MTVQTRVAPGIPAGGQFTATTHPEPEVGISSGPPFAKFPHPDRRYPPPMQCWPAGVEEPASIVLDSREGYTGNAIDPQEQAPSDLPNVVVTMRNGATFTIQRHGTSPEADQDEIFAGDWDAYGLTKDQLDAVSDTAGETLCQAAGDE